MAGLHAVRDEVLNHANVNEGEVLLDVGCGDGLIAFGALEKTKTGRVIFSDISQDLLDHARSIAGEMGVSERCEFLRAPAEDLSDRASDGGAEGFVTRNSYSVTCWQFASPTSAPLIH